MRQVKYLAMLLIALFCSTTINAQGIKIYQKSGEAIEITYTDIDSIVAYGDNSNKDKYEAVDLGLSVKWATCNVGATAPEEYGDYFAWGETKPKATYTEENSETYGKNIGDISGNPAYDAATANWGGSWRMPTEAEMQELVDNCTWKLTIQNGVKGFKVTGPNSNSIFLPAAGYRGGSSLYRAGNNGNYWSSTPSKSGAQDACYLKFLSGKHYLGWDCRNYGRSVRPVRK